MWNMYTNLSEGVRIKLPKKPFKEYSLNMDAFMMHSGNPIESNGFNIIIPPNEFFNQNYFLSTYSQSVILRKVMYSNDIKDLYPKIMYASGDKTIFEGQLGTYKNEYWSFQREWRYVLQFLPYGFKEMSDDAFKNNCQGQLLKLVKAIDLPFNYYFLNLDRVKFEQMQITLSPKINEGNKCIVKLLVEKYNPRIIIKDSILLGKIR